MPKYVRAALFNNKPTSQVRMSGAHGDRCLIFRIDRCADTFVCTVHSGEAHLGQPPANFQLQSGNSLVIPIRENFELQLTINLWERLA